MPALGIVNLLGTEDTTPSGFACHPSAGGELAAPEEGNCRSAGGELFAFAGGELAAPMLLCYIWLICYIILFRRRAGGILATFYL